MSTFLGQLYARQNRLDDALKQFRDIQQRNPKSVSAGTMVGMLLEGKGDRPGAEKQYGQVLSVDPRAGVAANNLGVAVRYAEGETGRSASAGQDSAAGTAG